MRITTLAILALAVLSSVVLSPVAVAGVSKCPRGGTTVVAGKDARVWAVRSRSGISRHYGCARRVGKVIRLDPRRGQLIASRSTTKLAGTTVAYETLSFDLRPYRIVVRSLRTGRVVHSATSNAQGTSMGHTGPALEVLLKRNGTVAWTADANCICEASEGDPPPAYEVHKIGKDRRRAVLDSGQEVDPASLRFSDRRTAVTWLRGGEPQTAPLGG